MITLAGIRNILDEHRFAETMRTLRRVTVATVTTPVGSYQIRSPIEGRAFEAYQAVGLQPPPHLLSSPRSPVHEDIV